jgi:hypothetical protein
MQARLSGWVELDAALRRSCPAAGLTGCHSVVEIGQQLLPRCAPVVEFEDDATKIIILAVKVG